MMVVDPVCEALAQKPPGRMKLGLKNISEAYACLKKPGLNIPTIIVGGTNGKGTTAGFLAEKLHAQGLKVGLFTSPHLRFFRERIQVSPQTVSDEEILKTVECIETRLPKELYQNLTFFELTTLCALVLFADHKVDAQILEVGLGGRLDSVNILQPIATIITSIGLDHTDLLGNTLQEIALEKLGICRKNVPLVWGDSHKAELTAFVQKYCSQHSIPFLTFEPSSSVKSPSLGTSPSLARNEFLADQVIDLIGSELPKKPKQAKTSAATWASSLQCRTEWKALNFSAPQRTETFLLDTCHNQESVELFCSFIDELKLLKENRQKKVYFYFVPLADKPFASMLERIQKTADKAMIFSHSSPRSVQLQQLPSSLLDNYKGDVSSLGDHLPIADDPSILVLCGSLSGLGSCLHLYETVL